MITFHFIQVQHLQIHPYAFNIISSVNCVEQDCAWEKKNISVVDFREGSLCELKTFA